MGLSVMERYKKYELNWMKENPPFSGPYTEVCLTKDEFIEKLKTDEDFNKEWGGNRKNILE